MLPSSAVGLFVPKAVAHRLMIGVVVASISGVHFVRDTASGRSPSPFLNAMKAGPFEKEIDLESAITEIQHDLFGSSRVYLEVKTYETFPIAAKYRPKNDAK
jgi:hypothetical protein